MKGKVENTVFNRLNAREKWLKEVLFLLFGSLSLIGSLSESGRFCYDAGVKSFWPIYFSALIIGTAGVYVIAPMCRPYVAPFFGKHPAVIQSTTPENTPSASTSLSPQVSETSSSPLLDTPAVSDELAPKLSEPKETEKPTVEDETDSPPALQRIYLASYGSKPEWGITLQQTSYYKIDGTRLGLAPGGLVFSYCATVPSSKGVMVKCQFFKGSSTNNVCLVGKKDVYLFTGAFQNLTPRQQKDLQSYYELNGKIVFRKNELLQASASKNPYFSSYQTAYQAYTAHIEKAKTIGQQRDQAVGLKRSNLEDQLREMRVKEMRLKIAYEAARKKFRVWKNQHATDQIDPENDPSIQTWTKEMAARKTTIPGLAM